MNLETTIRPNANPVQSEAMIDQTHFLQRALQADALFSGISGLMFLTAATPVANLLGFSDATAINAVFWLGVGLLGWATLALWTATRPQVTRGLVFTIIEGNLLWVIGSILLLLTGWLPFSTSGKWAVAIVADVVGLLAILQYVGWRRLTKG